MAKHNVNPLQLKWGRQPTGEFLIEMVAVFPDHKQQLRTVQIRSWILSKQEEENLKQALSTGLVITSVIPANGHHEA